MLVYTTSNFFRLLMRRERTQALFLECAPEDMLSTISLSKYFRRPGVLEACWAVQSEMASRCCMGVATQEHIFLSSLRQKNKEEDTENGRLGVQIKTKRSFNKLSFKLFMTPTHNAFLRLVKYFLGIRFTGWQTQECCLRAGYVPCTM